VQAEETNQLQRLMLALTRLQLVSQQEQISAAVQVRHGKHVIGLGLLNHWFTAARGPGSCNPQQQLQAKMIHSMLPWHTNTVRVHPG
jgi:hypothetical protein